MDVFRFTGDEFDQFVKVIYKSKFENRKTLEGRLVTEQTILMPKFRLEINHMRGKHGTNEMWIEFKYDEEAKSLSIYEKYLWFVIHIQQDGSFHFSAYGTPMGKDLLTEADFEEGGKFADVAKIFIEDFYNINYYLEHCIPNAYKISQKTERLINSHITDEKTDCKPSKRYLVSVHSIGYIKDSYIRPPEQELYAGYHCLCWGVRGHIRHYKNGKTAFIKAYEKGKKRGEIEPKTKEYRVKENIYG